VLGNVTDTTDANGVVTHTIYDELNRPVAVIQNYRPPLQPDAETNVRIEYTYNAVGNRIQVKDANGHVTAFQYDALNRVTEKIDPLGNTWQYSYDLAGRLTAQVDGNNKTTSYSYDDAGRLIGIDYPAPEADVTITYNAAGQQTEMTDGQGTTSWNYDDLGRLTAVTHPDGGKVEYTYDAFGRRQTLTSHIDAADLTGKTVTYAYDADGRLSMVTDWQAQATQYGYDALGRVETIERPNGITSRYTYDAAGRLTDLAHSLGMNTLSAYHYTYDAAGNRVSAREQVLGVPVTAPTQFAVVEQSFTAISLGWPDSTIDETGYRLERSADNQISWQVIADLPANTLRYTDEGVAPDAQYGYRLTPYDAQGDGPAETLEAETQPAVTISYTYDALQRLTAASYNDGTIFDYTYDATGNTLQLEKTVAGQTETTVYTYDIANQLATGQAGSGTAWQYQYDGNGSLVEITPGEQAASGAKRYTYNTAGQLTKVETHDGSAYQPQAEMIYDGQGQRLAMTGHQGSLSLTSHYLLDGQTTIAATADGQTTYYLSGMGEYQADWRYYLADGMGNVRQVIDAQGQVAGTRSFTPWGEILSQSGQDDLTAGYLGGMLDAATGLIYIGNGQYYDPATGRFLTRDANPSQTNPYVPWKSDPAGAMLAPLALLAMVYGRKKKRGKWDQLVILLVLCGTVGISLSACGPQPTVVNVPGVATATITSTPTPTQPKEVHVEVTATTVEGKPTATFTLTPTVTPTLPPGCSNKVWWSGYDEDAGNLEKIAKRLYFEGASSFRSEDGGTEIRKEVFMAQAWALRTLQAYMYYSSYTWITQNAFSVSSAKDSQDWIYDNDYIEITRCILNSQPCVYGSNPWSSGNTSGKAIQWISSQNLNRRNEENQAVTFSSNLVGGCETDCQLPDMRSRSWINDIKPVKPVGKAETFVDLGVIDTTGDGKADFNECYWVGVYFFDDRTSFQTATNGIYFPPPSGAEKESLKCPQGISGPNVNLPVMPSLYTSP